MVLFEEEKEFQRNTARFYNPKINKVSVIVEGKPNQLFAQGMKPHEQYGEICKYFAEGKNTNVVSGEVQKELGLYDMTASDFYNYKFALWLDFRTIDENELHGTGRRIDNASEGITLQIEKEQETAGPLKAYVYLIMDAQLNIRDGQYSQVLY